MEKKNFHRQNFKRVHKKLTIKKLSKHIRRENPGKGCKNPDIFLKYYKGCMKDIDNKLNGG